MLEKIQRSCTAKITIIKLFIIKDILRSNQFNLLCDLALAGLLSVDSEKFWCKIGDTMMDNCNCCCYPGIRELVKNSEPSSVSCPAIDYLYEIGSIT